MTLCQLDALLHPLVDAGHFSAVLLHLRSDLPDLALPPHLGLFVLDAMLHPRVPLQLRSLRHQPFVLRHLVRYAATLFIVAVFVVLYVVASIFIVVVFVIRGTVFNGLSSRGHHLQSHGLVRSELIDLAGGANIVVNLHGRFLALK
jgi:hypothetical protein